MNSALASAFRVLHGFGLDGSGLGLGGLDLGLEGPGLVNIPGTMAQEWFIWRKDAQNVLVSWLHVNYLNCQWYKYHVFTPSLNFNSQRPIIVYTGMLTMLFIESQHSKHVELANVLHFLSSAGRRLTENGTVTLGHVLAFATGSEEEPLLGFGLAPSIAFVDGSLPKANTCICRLQLPTDVSASQESTFDKFDLAFCNSYFGYIWMCFGANAPKHEQLWLRI